MIRFNMPVVPVEPTDIYADGCKLKIDCGKMPLYFRNVFSASEIDTMDFYISRKTFDDGTKALFASPTTSIADPTFALSFIAPEGYHLAKLSQAITIHTYHQEKNKFICIGQLNDSLYPYPELCATFCSEGNRDMERYLFTGQRGEYKVLHRVFDSISMGDSKIFVSVGNGSRYFTPTRIEKNSTIYVNPAYKRFERTPGEPYYKMVSDYFRKSIPDSANIVLTEEADLVNVVSTATAKHTVFVGYSKPVTAKARVIANKNAGAVAPQTYVGNPPAWEELPLDHEKKVDTES